MLDYIDPNNHVKLYDYTKISVKLFIAKVYFNMVYNNIFVNTPPPPIYRPHDGHITTTPSDSTTARHDDGMTTSKTRRLRLHQQPYDRAYGSGKTVVCLVSFLQS